MSARSLYYRLMPDGSIEPVDALTAATGDLVGKRVANTEHGSARVSTVFLAINHAFDEDAPIVFESMAFGAGAEELEQERYSTIGEAIEGHLVMCERVFNKDSHDQDWPRSTTFGPEAEAFMLAKHGIASEPAGPGEVDRLGREIERLRR